MKNAKKTSRSKSPHYCTTEWRIQDFPDEEVAPTPKVGTPTTIFPIFPESAWNWRKKLDPRICHCHLCTTCSSSQAFGLIGRRIIFAEIAWKWKNGLKTVDLPLIPATNNTVILNIPVHVYHLLSHTNLWKPTFLSLKLAARTATGHLLH